MCEIFNQIEEYIKQNSELDIKDIIVSYIISKQLRDSKYFTYTEQYSENKDLEFNKECYMGDLKISTGDKFRLVCDVSLEDDEVFFE